MLSRIAALSFETGFEWLVLNGLPQAENLYPDARVRDCGSIDLLIAPGELMRVADALQAAGFAGGGERAAGTGLAHEGLRADRRITLTDPVTDEPVHLHQRLFFAGSGTAVLREDYRPRRSAHAGDIPAPPVGVAMALDILLRGNARRWAQRKWLLDLSAIVSRLDGDAAAELIRAIDRAGFSPGAAASLLHCRDAAGAVLPEAIDAWLAGWTLRPEVAVRLDSYRSGPSKLVIPPVAKAAPQRGILAKLRARLVRMLRRPLQYTSEPATRIDRYPLAFGFARERIDTPAASILSFGCSTGEEVLTLRGYFPDAILRGIDVDPNLIATARQRMANDPQASFAVAGTAACEPAQRYDAIFCMAVFRDPALDLPGTRRADGPVTFAAFEREIGEMVRCLKPGGLLFVEHANFRVADTRAAESLEAVLHSDPPGSGLEPGLYGRDGLRIDGAVDRSLGFVKLEE